MKLWVPNEDDGDVDLTPMIDIVFLLIVFFMTVANMITAEKHPIRMPVSIHSEIPEEYGDRTTVTVLRDGSIYAGVYAVDLDELGDILKRELEANDEVKVYLRADGDAEHQYVNDIMKKCAEIGLNKIVFAAYQSDK